MRFRLEPVAPLVGVEVEVILHHVAEGIANAAVAEGVVNRVHLVARGHEGYPPCRRWCSVTRGDLCRFDLLPDLPSSIRRLTVYMASQCRQGDQVPGDDQTQLDGQRDLGPQCFAATRNADEADGSEAHERPAEWTEHE